MATIVAARGVGGDLDSAAVHSVARLLSVLSTDAIGLFGEHPDGLGSLSQVLMKRSASAPRAVKRNAIDSVPLLA